MKLLNKVVIIKLFLLVSFFSYSNSFGDSHDIYEILDKIQNDIKTLEKAVYSKTNELKTENNNSSISSNYNSEDVLTRHLLKLSEIENQFQQLTNKFEEINFKLDKL